MSNQAFPACNDCSRGSRFSCNCGQICNLKAIDSHDNFLMMSPRNILLEMATAAIRGVM